MNHRSRVPSAIALLLTLLAAPQIGLAQASDLNQLLLSPQNIIATFGTNTASGTIQEYTPDGVLIRSVRVDDLPCCTNLRGTGVGPDGRLYAAVLNSSSFNRLLAISPAGDILSEYELPSTRSTGVVYGKVRFFGGLKAYLNYFEGLYELDLKTGLVTTFYSLAAVHGIAQLPNGNLLLAEREQIYEVDGATGARIREVLLTDPNVLSGQNFRLREVADIAYDAASNRLLVTQFNGTEGVFAFDYATGEMVQFNGIRGAVEMVIGADDTLLVGGFTVAPALLNLSDLTEIRQIDGTAQRYVSRYVPPQTPIAVAYPDEELAVVVDVPAEIDVVRNDVGFVGDVTLSIDEPPTRGVAEPLNSPGPQDTARIVYTPDSGFVGFDSFSYMVTDGTNTDTARVAIRVALSRAADDAFFAALNTNEQLFVLENDIGFNPDTVRLSIARSGDRGGSVSASNPSNGTPFISYTPRSCCGAPEPPFVETFEYTASDGVNTGTATVTVEVVRGVAQNDFASTDIDTTVVIDIADNDLGFNNRCCGNEPIVASFTVPKNGTVTYGFGRFFEDPEYFATYVPSPGFEGVDVFQYAVDDGPLVSIATVTVRVIVDPDSDGVAAQNDNCLAAANAAQRDTDNDGFGNFCDGDLNNDNFTNFADLALFRSRFGTDDADADLNGDGIVNFSDLGLFRGLFGKPPGPSTTQP